MLRDYNNSDISEGYYINIYTGTCYHVKKKEGLVGRFEATWPVHQENKEGTFVPDPENLDGTKASRLIRIIHPRDIVNFISTEMDPNLDFSE